MISPLTDSQILILACYLTTRYCYPTIALPSYWNLECPTLWPEIPLDCDTFIRSGTTMRKGQRKHKKIKVR